MVVTSEALNNVKSKFWFADIQMCVLIIFLHQMVLCLFISGWIYAVYSPVESVVFSGNFLHSFAISDQLSVYKLEQRLKVLPSF